MHPHLPRTCQPVLHIAPIGLGKARCWYADAEKTPSKWDFPARRTHSPPKISIYGRSFPPLLKFVCSNSSHLILNTRTSSAPQLLCSLSLHCKSTRSSLQPIPSSPESNLHWPSRNIPVFSKPQRRPDYPSGLTGHISKETLNIDIPDSSVCQTILL